MMGLMMSRLEHLFYDEKLRKVRDLAVQLGGKQEVPSEHVEEFLCCAGDRTLAQVAPPLRSSEDARPLAWALCSGSE